MRMKIIYCLYVFFTVIMSLRGSSLQMLPAPLRFPDVSSRGLQGCASCSSGDAEGSEIPYVSNSSLPLIKLNLLEETDEFNIGNGLFIVYAGFNDVFAPTTRYFLSAPDEKNPDSFRAMLSTTNLKFMTTMENLDEEEIFSTRKPGYSLKMINDSIVITNYNTGTEYFFKSLDGGSTWQVHVIRYLKAPQKRLICHYDREGMITKIELPGNRFYLIDYKFGQPTKLTSPSGAITTFSWDAVNNIKSIKTVLTSPHPFYLKSSDDADEVIVRDLFFKCDDHGMLKEVVNTTGERYLIDRTSEKDNLGATINTVTITYPDGSSKFKREIRERNRDRINEEGIVEVTNNQKKFIVLKRDEYTKINDLSVLRKGDKVTNEYGKKDSPLATASVDAVGNKTQYAYNSCGLVTVTTFADGSTIKSDYDKNWNKIQEIDECGRISLWTYNELGQLISQKFGEVGNTYEYDDSGFLSATKVFDRYRHEYTWDEFGRMTASKSPSGVITEYTYWGTLPKVKDYSIVSSDLQQKYTKTFFYDAQGRLVKILYPDNTTEEFAYDCCNLISQKSRSDEVLKYAYNQQKQKIREISSSGAVTNYEYDNVGHLRKITYPNGSTAYYNYDIKGLLISSGGTNRLEIKPSYDWMDRMVKQVRADGLSSEREYDVRNRITKLTGDLERNVEYTYDKSGNRIKELDWGLPKSEAPRERISTYDDSGRIVFSGNSENSGTKYGYVPGTDMIFYQANGDLYTYYLYDGFGRNIGRATVTRTELEEHPTANDREKLFKEKISQTTSYDQFGNMAKITDGTGNLLFKYTYAPSGELEKMLRVVSESTGILNTYKHHYNEKSEKVYSVYEKPIKLEDTK